MGWAPGHCPAFLQRGQVFRRDWLDLPHRLLLLHTLLSVLQSYANAGAAAVLQAGRLRRLQRRRMQRLLCSAS